MQYFQTPDRLLSMPHAQGITSYCQLQHDAVGSVFIFSASSGLFRPENVQTFIGIADQQRFGRIYYLVYRQ